MEIEARRASDALRQFGSDLKEDSLIRAIDTAAPILGRKKTEQLKAEYGVDHSISSPVDRIMKRMKRGRMIVDELQFHLDLYTEFGAVGRDE